MRDNTAKWHGLHIGLLGVEDPFDIRSYSGTPYHLAHYLKAAGHRLDRCGPYPLRHRNFVRIENKFSRALTGRHIVWERHPIISRQYARIVQQYVHSRSIPDLFLATSVFYLAKATAPAPLVAWGDTTAAGVINQYPYYQNLSKKMIQYCHSVEQDGLDSCDLVVFSNEWAARTALEHYSLNAHKVHVLTYGANLLSVPSTEEVLAAVRSRSDHEFRAVFIGVDWNRKGADTAIAVIRNLRGRGLKISLQIIGCTPPAKSTVPEFVQILGRIPKSTPAGAARICSLLSQAHVFLLPTKAECAAVSLAEANAFGVPVFSTDVGGNSSLVKNGVNGFLLQPTNAISDWSDSIESLLRDRDVYERFALSAYRYFQHELSWEVAVRRFETLVRKTVLCNKQTQSATSVDR